MARSRKPSIGADPVFAAEMQQAAEDRRQAFVGTFREEWAERLRYDDHKPLFQTTLHHHDDSCLGPPHQAQAAGGQWITVRRCVISNTSHEVAQ